MGVWIFLDRLSSNGVDWEAGVLPPNESLLLPGTYRLTIETQCNYNYESLRKQSFAFEVFPETEIQVDFNYGNDDQHVYFLNGVPLSVPMMVQGGDSWDVIEWSVNNGPWQNLSPLPEFDVGRDFGVGGSLHVRGRSSDGKSVSEVKRVNFDIIPVPPATGLLSKPFVGSKTAPLIYTAKGLIDMGLLGSTMGVDRKTGKRFPIITDEVFRWDVKLNNTIEVFGTGFARGIGIEATKESGFEFPILKKVKPKLGSSVPATLNWTYNPATREWIIGGSIGFGVSASRELVWPLWFPPPTYGSVNVSVDASARLDVMNKEASDSSPALQGTLGIQPRIRGAIGVGVWGLLNAEGYADGRGILEGSYSGTTPKLEKLNVSVEFGITSRIMFFELGMLC